MDPTGGWQRRHMTKHTSCRASISGLLAGKQYEFRVKPIGPVGDVGKPGPESKVFSPLEPGFDAPKPGGQLSSKKVV